MLRFNPENLKALHFFTKGLNYPVAIAAYSDWYLRTYIKNSIIWDGKSVKK